MQAVSRHWNAVVNHKGGASWFWKRVYELHFCCRISTHGPDWKSNFRHRLIQAADHSSPRDFSTCCSSASFDANGDDAAGFEFRNERDNGPRVFYNFSKSIRSNQQLFDLHYCCCLATNNCQSMPASKLSSDLRSFAMYVCFVRFLYIIYR